MRKCITHAVVATLTPECNDELDTVLRRAACLDPDTFTSEIFRCEACQQFSTEKNMGSYEDVGIEWVLATVNLKHCYFRRKLMPR